MTYPNWFKQIAQHNFEEFLLPLPYKKHMQFLQLGVFTGDASVWLCENVVNDDDSVLWDVDTWAGAANEPIQEEMDFNDVYSTYKSKVSKYIDSKKIIVTQESTVNFLLNESHRHNFFDFVYVDAHHTSASAFLDSELSWPLLKSGGLMAIDDYEWQHPDGVEIHAPKLGIHMFLDRHEGEFDTLKVNQQYWLRKR